MSTTLPHGLITVGYTKKPAESSNDADILFERFQVLHSFWKVHAIRYRVSKDASDFRCQNLFWRTWGDSELSRNVSTATLTSLWSLCQQNIDRASLRNGNNLQLPSAHRPSVQTESSAPLSKSDHGEDVPRLVASRSSGLSGSTLRQDSPADRELKDKGINVEETKSLGVAIDLGSKPFKGTRPSLSRADSSGVKSSFGGSSSRTKARPSMNRRKSSQGAPQPNKQAKASKVITRSPTLTSKEMKKVDEVPSVATTSTFELPSASSWEDEPAMEINRHPTSASYSGTPSDLVEPNFRNKFAERIASSTNLAGISRMKKTGSVVRFADESSVDLRKEKDREYDSASDNNSPLSQSRRGSVASVAVIDEDENETPPTELQRTKSQLSMMIKEMRSQRDRKSIDYTPPDGQMGLSSRRRREPTEEEKVLAMARSEGFTRSGGRQIRRGFKLNDEDESRYSSPSPPPLF